MGAAARHGLCGLSKPETAALRHTPALLLAAAFAPIAAAAPAEGARSVAALLGGWSEPGGDRVAGLSIALAPGWKTYWRAPGEAGLPPVFDWSGSSNVAAVTVEWPAPEVFDSFGVTTLGYSGEVVLPLVVTPADPALPVSLRLALDYGVCRDICVPASAELTLEIAPDAPPEAGALIAAHRARAPRDAASAGLLRAECGVAGSGTDRRFAGRLVFDRTLRATPLVVIEGPEGVWIAPPDVARRGSELSLAAEAQVWGGPDWIARDALRLTLIGPEGAVEVRGCVAPQG